MENGELTVDQSDGKLVRPKAMPSTYTGGYR